jgi:two-component system LytT family response regulator
LRLEQDRVKKLIQTEEDEVGMTTRVMIVDDEAPARERLRRFLEDIKDVEIIAEAFNGLQAVEIIQSCKPDLVFLDIQMPGLDGFGVLDALREPPPIIFVTAYDEYAIQAFEVNALDYLLKPFSKERLQASLQRAKEKGQGDRRFEEKLNALLMTLAEQEQYLAKLAVWHRSNVRLIDVDQIDWIGIEENQPMVYVGEELYSYHRTLAYLEKKLDPRHFFRVHRSAIVNLDRVAEIIPWFKGSHKVRLSTGAEVELSRVRTRELKKLLDW